MADAQPLCWNGDGHPAHSTSAFCSDCISRQKQPRKLSSADCGTCGVRFATVTAFDSHEVARYWSEVHHDVTTYHGTVTHLDPATIPGLVLRPADGVWGLQSSFDTREAFSQKLEARRHPPGGFEPYATPLAALPAYARVPPPENVRGDDLRGAA